MNTYQSYLNHPAGNTLPVEEALQIYTALTESVKKCSIEDVSDFYNDMVKKSCKYASIRSSWEFMSNEERMSADVGRTSSHNVLIDSVNILARVIKSDGIETAWRDNLGDNRKKIGDFACFVAYITGICNR